MSAERGASSRQAALARQAQLTKPLGSLGRLEDVVAQLAWVQERERPVSRPAAALIFAADHPVNRHGISAYPQEVTRKMVENLVAGGAAASVACRHLGVELRVVDVGALGSATPGSVRAAVAEASEGDLVATDAMDDAVFAQATQAGRDAVARLPDDVRILILGEMGIGNTTLASAVACAVLGRSPTELVGRGAGADEAMLVAKRAVVEAGLARVGPVTPREALRRLGGRELAAIDGAAQAAIARNLVVLVDGAIVTAALLPLLLEQPQARHHFLFAHVSAEASHAVMLQAVGAQPLLALGMRLGEASGALMALPLVDLACSLHDGMATFAQAAVPGAR